MPRKLTPDQMVKPIALAPFEIAECMALWALRYSEFWTIESGPHEIESEAQAQELIDALDGKMPECCGGLGPPFRMNRELNTEFAERVATAIHTLIKEI